MKDYYFENLEEFLKFVELNPGVDATWNAGPDYINLYKKGYDLFEQGKYGDVINTMKRCIEINPIAVSARFEIVESYIQMQDYVNAKETLHELAIFLSTNESKARFYRRRGFIATEEKDYELSFACFKKSLEFEKSRAALDEIVYLMSVSGKDFKNVDPNTILADNDISLPETKTQVAKESKSIEQEKPIEKESTNYDKDSAFANFLKKYKK